MYTIYADDVLLYTPDVEELCLYDIVLTMEDNSDISHDIITSGL